MTKDDKEIVSALLAALADRVGWQRFKLWFSNQTRLQLSEDMLYVDAPNRFVIDWLRAKHRKDLEFACQQVLGNKLSIVFRVDPLLGQQNSTQASETAADADLSADATVPAASSPTGSSQTLPFPGSRNGHRQDPQPACSKPPRRRPYCRFETFVEGTSNKLALTSAQLVSGQLGSLSPLVIHGATGTGKTHLLESIYSDVRSSHKRARAVYLTAEQFTTDFLEALNGKGLPNFRQKVRDVDLLVLDDTHFMVGKRATLIELQNTVDVLMRQNRQVVLSLDRPLGDLPGLGAELISRLSGGLVCGLETPEFSTRLGILKRFSTDNGWEVPADVLEVVASRITTNTRELSGALNRIHAMSLATGRPMQRELAEEMLAGYHDSQTRPVRLQDIDNAVCEVFGLEPKALQSQRKSRTVSHPRMLAMFLARKFTRAALSEIGHHFGGRSHSTVISAQKKVADWMQQQDKHPKEEHAWDIEAAMRRVEAKLKLG